MPNDTKSEPLTFETLNAKQQQVSHSFPDQLSLRVHRALSWLRRAEMAGEDRDAAFIFYWIAFNAAYADNREDVTPAGERQAFEDYFSKIVELDKSQLIYEAIWTRFSSSIRLFLDNRYVFQPFWSHQNGEAGYDDWEERFQKSKRRVRVSLAGRNTKAILTTLFDRMYVLRNQLVHGGATWNSSINRTQVTDGAQIMSFLMPLFIDLMMDNSKIPWGAPYYPVVE
ncbi:MAG: hypothetical protein WBS24_09995 [Terriglobales bacterium]